jgi:hypothetical protein
MSKIRLRCDFARSMPKRDNRAVERKITATIIALTRANGSPRFFCH